MTDAAVRRGRLDGLRAQMERAGAQLVVLAPTDNLRWLLGFAPLHDERACLTLVTPERAVMVVPSLNAEQVAAEVGELELVRWPDEAGPVPALDAALRDLGADRPSVALADPEMRADHLLLLQAALPDARTRSAGEAMGALRMVKDATELAALRRAAAVADDAVRAGWAACAPGVSERAVAEAVGDAFRAADSSVGFAIVAGGPHAAFPHHETGVRALSDGEPVLLDVGGGLAGYVSDVTRMAFLGEPDDRYREVHAVVDAAVSAASATAVPGATCGEVDSAARAVVDGAGYGQYFVHRTGHGLGLSVHEPPWVMAGSEVELVVGTVHSIEPGIYLPGAFGVRLEEIVQVTPAGGVRFSALPRDVHVIA